MFEQFNRLPESTIEEIEYKRKEYAKMTSGAKWLRLKTLADIQVAQFFIPKDETNVRKIVTDEEYMDYLSGTKAVHGLKAGKAGGIAGEKRFFHWFLEFPEVFTPSPAGEGRGEAKGGFDCILGNPPFLGDKKLRGAFGASFLEYVKYVYAPAGSCDLVTYFFRRIFNIIRGNGFLSLISTNTISQGASKEGGLDIIVSENGTINFALNSIKWPGVAEVVVSLVSIFKGKWQGQVVFGNKKVLSISSLLRTGDFLENPNRLLKNSNISFIGNYVLGTGFILSLDEGKALLKYDKKNSDVIYPYLNGNDLNSNFDQRPSRDVINFFDWEIEKAKEYTECFRIVETKVKPERKKKADKSCREKWWQHARIRPHLYNRIKRLDRVLVVAQVSKTVAFVFVPRNQVYDSKLIVFAFDEYKEFAILQSNIHVNWAWKYCTTMKTDLSYGPSRIFETFPFPQDVPKIIESGLHEIGWKYHDFRRQVMLKTKLGLTKTYNLFHTNDLKIQHIVKVSKQTQETCEEVYKNIIELRDLHKQMDEMVLKAYGWEDIDLAHDFYEVDYLPENDRVRYIISPDARKEVLKRLLKLNHEIHEQEVKAGLHTKGKTKKKQKADASKQIKLF